MSSNNIVITADPQITIVGDSAAVTAVVPVNNNPVAYSSLSGLPTLGTAAALNAGTGANNVPQLNSSGQLPAVDGTQLLNASYPECGYFSYVNSTTCKFSTYKGSLIKINGVLQLIPSTPITISNTGLSATNTYYFYAYMNSGVLALEASTTTHVTSTTAGNVGTEIKNGDDSRTLVGMAYTNSSSQFVAMSTISWFNRQLKMNVSPFSNLSTTSTTVVTLNAGMLMVNWANELVLVFANGQGGVSSTGNVFLAIGLDGTTVFGANQYSSLSSSLLSAFTCIGSGYPIEGPHTYYEIAGVSAAGLTGYWYNGFTITVTRG